MENSSFSEQDNFKCPLKNQLKCETWYVFIIEFNLFSYTKKLQNIYQKLMDVEFCPSVCQSYCCYRNFVCNNFKNKFSQYLTNVDKWTLGQLQITAQHINWSFGIFTYVCLPIFVFAMLQLFAKWFSRDSMFFDGV